MSGESQSESRLDALALPRLQSPIPLSEKAYLALEQMIVDGVLPPGMHLVEEDLSRQLGVSRHPVREALRRLGHDGYAQHRRDRGFFVHLPNAKEMQDIFHVRALLESECARLAAERISMEALGVLNQAVTMGHQAIKRSDAVQLLDLNESFHSVIVAAADNAELEKFLTIMRRRVRWYFSSIVLSRAVGSWREHEAILGALRRRDGETAASLMSAHVGRSLEKIVAANHITRLARASTE